MNEPSVLLQHVVLAVIAPIPGVLVGAFVGRRLARIEVKVNGQMEKLRKRVAELEREHEES